MMFRKIYWVVEETRQGEREVKGVFTSMNDLVERYLERVPDNRPDAFRITLTKLDMYNGILGTWASPGFDNVREELQKFVATGEFTIDECDRVASMLTGVYA